MKRRRRRFGWRTHYGFALLLALALVPVFASIALRRIPLPPALFLPPPAAVELTDREGRLLREVSPTESVSRPAALDEIPSSLVEATLAAEDRRFWDHHGVDWRASARAAWQLVRHRRIVSGGSTITQQLIKLAQPQPRTLRTKLIEVAQALRLEQVWSKQQILTAYLSRVDYGHLRRGCASAAAFYFGRSLADLSLAEAAFLAGLPQAPTRLNPHRHFDRALRRQQWILDRMLFAGWLSEDEHTRARSAPIHLRPPRREFAAPHFVDLVLQSEAAALRRTGSGRLQTTLDRALQRATEIALREQLGRLQDRHVQQGAVVVIEVRTGDVLALVGSGDYFSPQAGQVNGAWAPRSAGSTFKPFTYLIAFERGSTPATVVADVPTEFATPTGLFAPLNYDRHCHGPTRYREALANSLNISAVKVLNAIGGAAVLQERLRACGLTTLNASAETYGLGLTIGNAEARLLELANAYACLARLGSFQPYRLLRASSSSLPESSSSSSSSSSSNELGRDGCEDEDEDEDEEEDGQGRRRVFDPDAAWLIADVLADNTARAVAFGLDSALRFDFPVACKTGTSTDFRDNWAFGYTPEYVVGVWVGNFDGTPMRGVSGVSGAAPVLRAVLTHLHERCGTTWYPAPTALVERTVHPLTGKQVAPDRPDAIPERFLAGALPPWEAPGDYDDAGRARLPAEYQAWLASGENWLGARAVLGVSGDSGASGAPSATRLPRVTQPLPGSVFVLDPDLPDSGRRLRLCAEAAGPVSWWSSTLFIESQPEGSFVRLGPGRHELVARDEASGAVARTWIEVRRL